MAVKVRGVYENGVVYLTEPLPEDFPATGRREVEVSLEPVGSGSDDSAPVEDEEEILAEIDRIDAEIRAFGDPRDDTPERRAKRVSLVMKALSIGPPMSVEVEEALLESIKRPMSMFALPGEQNE